jgi:four helix bundle protein
LQAWQEARTVVLGALTLVREAWKPYASALFSQLQRASLSVQLNIAEGYAYANSPSFSRHLAIAYGSAVETGELLEIAIDAGIIAERSEGNSSPTTKGASGFCWACLGAGKGNS